MLYYAKASRHVHIIIQYVAFVKRPSCTKYIITICRLVGKVYTPFGKRKTLYRIPYFWQNVKT